MFVAPAAKSVDPRSNVSDSAKAGQSRGGVSALSRRADHDFQQFVARHGSFTRYLPHAL